MSRKRKAESLTPQVLLKKIKSLEKQVLELQNDQEESDDFVSFKSGTQYFTTLRSTIERYPDSNSSWLEL